MEKAVGVESAFAIFEFIVILGGFQVVPHAQPNREFTYGLPNRPVRNGQEFHCPSDFWIEFDGVCAFIILMGIFVSLRD